MADGFELYHVPQQSRRDKLRIPAPPQNYHDTNSNDDLGLIPSYDPGLLTCAGHRPNPSENPNFTGFPLNPQNPNPSDSQFLYPANNREFDDSSSRQGLSLSLSSPGHLPMEVNFHCPAPPGPFTGYTCILKGSVFLRPAQLILQEMCEFGGSCSVQKMDPDPSLLDPPTDESYSGLDDICATGSDGVKSRLISMLVEVYRRYKQYSQQLQAAVATFESIPGLNNAAPSTNFALTALSKHFKCLKTAITDQLQLMSKATSNLTARKHRKSDENDNFALCSQRPVHNGARTLDSQPVWRPQRGLPERSVSVLRAWLFEHFLHPYPTDSDKMMLAKQTGLSRNQVSNWFINARVRLWKPMVEEIHALETRQQVHHVKLSTSSSSRTEAAIKVGPTNRSSSGLKALDSDNPPEKRVRNELVDQLPQFGGGNGNYSNVNGGVSLTLALHQNSHGMSGLLDPYPTLALAHCYGLSSAHEDDRGFQPHNTQFSTRGNLMTGQISRDFIS